MGTTKPSETTNNTNIVITAALPTLSDPTVDADRVFFANSKASAYFSKCVQYVSNSGELRFLGSFKGEVGITTYKNSSTYVTTTSPHYVDYAWDEVVFHVHSSIVRFVCWGLLIIVKLLCRFSDVDNEDVCFFNSYLVSTNLYRDEADVAKHIESISVELSESYGKNVCVFRCLDRIGTPNLLEACKKDENTVLVISRVVNHIDPSDMSIWQKSNCKKDGIILHRHIGATRADIVAVQDGTIKIQQVIDRCAKESTASTHLLRLLRSDEPLEVYERMQQVYSVLYLEKYSKHNPGYTAEFFQNVSQIWDIMLLERRADHVIEGFMCMSDVGGDFVSCPALGYDFDSTTPSYIILQFWAILEARSRNKRLNMSGGVTAYKQLRGAIPVLEYSGVRFAPGKVGFTRKFFWLALGFLTSKVVKPIVRRKNIT